MEGTPTHLWFQRQIHPLPPHLHRLAQQLARHLGVGVGGFVDIPDNNPLEINGLWHEFRTRIREKVELRGLVIRGLSTSTTTSTTVTVVVVIIIVATNAATIVITTCGFINKRVGGGDLADFLLLNIITEESGAFLAFSFCRFLMDGCVWCVWEVFFIYFLFFLRTTTTTNGGKGGKVCCGRDFHDKRNQKNG